MRTIALTGSIGSGKSTVAALLRGLGVWVLDADALAREGAEVHKAEICSAFPEVCVEGVIDRAALGRRVFADVEAKKRLEAILHPYVRQRMAEQTQAVQQAGQKLVVQDIPLLYETGRQAEYAGVLLVVAPTALRMQRVRQRSGLSEAEFLARDANQLPQDQKARLATWVLHNDSTSEALAAQVEAWLRGVS